MKTKWINFFIDIKRNKFSYLLALPAIAYTFIFGYLTIPYMILAFQRYNFQKGILGSEFVGLKNFEFFFKSNDVFVVIFNTLKLNLLFIAGTTILALIVSILLNELKDTWMKRFIQSNYLLPYFMSWVIVSYMMY